MIEGAMLSERQNAEWGVRSMKGPFCRLKTILPSNGRTRLSFVAIRAHLHNFRVRRVRLNQLRSVYGGLANNSQLWLLELYQQNKLCHLKFTSGSLRALSILLSIFLFLAVHCVLHL